jgi:flagellar hook-associated protein 2
VNEIDYFTDEEREKALEELGTFRADITLMQLKNRLQRITSSPYETSLERELSMLSQIGISTNASVGGGGSVNVSKLRGYLEINEEVLDKSLQTNSRAIKELFGQDTDGDLVIDSGAGYELDRFLNPYIQTGGIFSTKIRMLDNGISDTNDEIEDYKEYLADYESDLKRKYGSMEGMLNQLESNSSSLDTFNQQNNN